MTSAERAEEVFTHFTERLEALEEIVASNATAFDTRLANLERTTPSVPVPVLAPAPAKPVFAASLRYANKPCADCGTHLRAGVPGYFQRAIKGVQKSAIYCTPCGGARGGA